MCGICGVISRTALSSEAQPSVSRMTEALRHRGPDGEGLFQDGHVVMAMRRLSIIDLQGGWQPLYNEDRSLVLVANGEIYNFVELREDLAKRGHHFSTATDCETILHLYEEYGTDCVLHLRGMFAFALWDVRRNRLMLARDRMGEKPMYLYEKDGQLFFASEMKALLQSGAVTFELDPAAIHYYFHYQYVPEPMTAVRGVRKLDAAHLLTVDVDPWQVHEACYWRMEDAPPLEGNPVEIIRSVLDEVAGLVIRSDVPVGVALSGGLDSSVVAALAARKYPGTMHAFSVGYPGRPSFDERSDAKALSDHLGMPFHDVEVTVDDMVAFFPELNAWRDDPIADISGYGYYAVQRLAREHDVPVILQGQGGDELFWGYSWVQQAARESREKEIVVQRGYGAWPAYIRGGGFFRGWREFAKWKRSDPRRMVLYDLASDYLEAAGSTHSIYTSEFNELLGAANPDSVFSFDPPWPRPDLRITRLICDTYLRENGVTQGDRLSMASSIELRLPLLDYRFVETVIGLRKGRTDLDLPPKAWFRETCRDILPDAVLRRPKRGFEPPVTQWYEALFNAYGEQIPNGYLSKSGILDAKAAQHLSLGIRTPGVINPLSFKALILEIWCQQMRVLSKKAC